MLQIKPVPYYTQIDDAVMKQCAKELRSVFIPQLARRLPMHHLSGFKHNDIINYVAKWKKEYPFFFRADISKFYPSVSAFDLITMVQIAYRDLFGLDYVPKKFKDRFLNKLVYWAKSLPIKQGIPLGSNMSAILAPLGLLPIWLQITREYHVKFIVFMDDILVLCKDENTARDVWHFLAESLDKNLKLQLNVTKTKSGRLSSTNVEFCGWCFTGGYAKISVSKYEQFKTRLLECISKTKNCETRSFIKQLNRKIDGFGNYYKHGHVTRQFEELDCFIRTCVRKRLSVRQHAKTYSNAQLNRMGLHSLELNYRRLHTANNTPNLKQVCPPVLLSKVMNFGKENQNICRQTELIEVIGVQLTQLIRLQRKQNRLLETIAERLIVY